MTHVCVNSPNTNKKLFTSFVPFQTGNLSLSWCKSSHKNNCKIYSLKVNQTLQIYKFESPYTFSRS